MPVGFEGVQYIDCEKAGILQGPTATQNKGTYEALDNTFFPNAQRVIVLGMGMGEWVVMFTFVVTCKLCAQYVRTLRCSGWVWGWVG